MYNHTREWKHSHEWINSLAIAFCLGIYTSGWAIYHTWCQPCTEGIILFNGTLMLAVWSYLRTVFTDPGTHQSPEFTEWKQCLTGPSSCYKPRAKSSGDQGSRRKRYRWAPGEITMCDKCQQPRPERAHHCRHCGSCVLFMDHHCPIVANCIGWRNYKFFILTNWWSCCATAVYVATMNAPNALEVFKPMRLFLMSPSAWNFIMLLPAISVVVASVLCIVTGGTFLGMLQNASQNLTTIEGLLIGCNPYRQLSCLDNFRHLLGPLDFTLVIPIEPTARTSGTSFAPSDMA